MTSVVLSSKWTGLNPHLLATLYPVGPAGLMEGGPHVASPITESNIEMTANWQSPFEQSGVESKAPAITAMLQSGALRDTAQALGEAATAAIAALDRALPGLGTMLDRVASNLPGAGTISQFASETLSDAQGRSGMTKLNSTNIFSGAAPVKIAMTLHFRAFSDPRTEVQEPVDQLARWCLAKSLAKSGALAEAIRGDSVVSKLLPSLAPQMIGLRYGGYTFAPLVIESMGYPITVPRTRAGGALHVTVQLMLASLTALDSEDWNRARNGHPAALFNSS